MTHIENSDRGITLSKSLAWSVLAFVAGGGFWVGVTLSDLTSQSKTTADAVAGLERTLSSERQARASLASRIERLERGAARDDQRLMNIEAGVARITAWIDRQER